MELAPIAEVPPILYKDSINRRQIKGKDKVFSLIYQDVCYHWKKGGTSAIKIEKKLRFFFFIAFGLHYLCSKKYY